MERGLKLESVDAALQRAAHRATHGSREERSGRFSPSVLTVYMDESGFTGEDLSNSKQPLFVHVSTTLSSEECTALYKEHFSGVQGNELKHKNLSKWPKGQARIISFIKALKGENSKATVWVCHKEFTLLTYLVDLWVEPAMHLDGIDLYRDGGNLALSNMAYFCLRAFQGEHFLSNRLGLFQQMMIHRTKRSFDEFFGALHRDMAQVDQRTRSILIMFLGAGMKLGCGHLVGLPKRALDPAFTTAVNTCGYWQRLSKASLRLIHDESSNLAKDSPVWDLITSPKIQKTRIGVIGREIEFPLKITKVTFADSKSHLQLQFCDLVAGASVAWHRQLMGSQHNEDYAKRLGAAGIEELRIGVIWPSPDVDPDALGTRGMSGAGIDALASELASTGRPSRKAD
jgi:hypothetical protein